MKYNPKFEVAFDKNNYINFNDTMSKTMTIDSIFFFFNCLFDKILFVKKLVKVYFKSYILLDQ